MKLLSQKIKIIGLLCLTILTTVKLYSQEYSVFEISAGSLNTRLTDLELDTTIALKLIGNIDARDFKTMRDSMPNLASIDLSETNIVYYEGYDGTHYKDAISHIYVENIIPVNAFSIKALEKKH